MSNLCGYVQIDTHALQSEMKTYIVQEMERESDRLIEMMRREIARTIHGDGPGKPEWRQELAEEMREVYRIVANEAIEFGVGLPHMSYASAGHKFVRAMLIAYGGGSATGGSPIRTRPGELVWDDDLRDYEPSVAMTERQLPDLFNQVGNNFIENAMEMMRVHFEDMLGRIWAQMPNRIFWGNTRAMRR